MVHTELLMLISIAELIKAQICGLPLKYVNIYELSLNGFDMNNSKHINI